MTSVGMRIIEHKIVRQRTAFAFAHGDYADGMTAAIQVIRRGDSDSRQVSRRVEDREGQNIRPVRDVGIEVSFC